MRFVCWFMSFMIVVASTQSAYAASSAGWTASAADTVMAGATATITAFKNKGGTAMKAVISHKPTALAVGKEIIKGGGLLAVAWAAAQLLDAGIDWVMTSGGDIKYKDPSSVGGVAGYKFRAPPVTAFSASPAAACKAYMAAYPESDGRVYSRHSFVPSNPPSSVSYVCYFKLPNGAEYGFQAQAVADSSAGGGADEYKVIPLATVAQTIIGGAEAGEAVPQDFVKAVAVGAVESGDLDVPLDAVAEPTTDAPTDTPVDPAKPYDDTGIKDLLKRLLASIVAMATGLAELTGFMNSDLPPEKTDTSVDVVPSVPAKAADSFDVDYVAFGGQCPVMPSSVISVGVVSVPLSFNMTPLCDLANAIRPAVLAIAYFVGLGVVASAIRET